MPTEISTIAMEEKNKLNTESVFFVALEIDIPSLTETVKINNGGDNVTWRGSTWVQFPVEIDEVLEKTGEVPQVNLRVSNVNRVFDAYLQQYDLFCKQNGFKPIKVKMFVLNNLNLADTTPEAEYEFTLEKPTLTADWAVFALGASNPFLRRFPQQRMLKNQCRWRFKSTQCGYSGGMNTCNKTLVRCRELSNSSRYGGFPAVGSRGLRIA